jgi:hypothetical protein
VLIALLAVLGVDLIVVVALAALVISRRRWLKRQPGQFAGAIRVSSGSFEGLSSRWGRGSCRRVRDVLLWNKAPFLFRSEVVPVDRVVGERQAQPGEVKRLGDEVYVIELASGDTTIEVAARAEDRVVLTEPFGRPV